MNMINYIIFEMFQNDFLSGLCLGIIRRLYVSQRKSQIEEK